MPAPSPLEPPPDSEHEDIAATPSATTTTPPDTTSSAPSPPTLSFPSSPAPPTQPVTSKLHGGAPISTSLSTRSVVAPYSIFTPRAKWLLVLLISTAGLFSPLTANIFFPAIPTIAQDLATTVQQVNLSITWYMILQGVAPSLFGSIADVIGRRPVYLMTFVVYIGASIGLANTHGYALLVVLRCLQASGSSSVIAIGSGSIGDIASPSERGLYMSIFALGPMVGPCLGPVVGGVLAQHFGWQSLFWFLTASGGVVLVIMAICLPETLRSIVGNGSIPAPTINRSLYSLLRERRHRDDPVDPNVIVPAMPPRKGWRDVNPLVPLKMFREKDTLLTLTFNSMCYALFYCVITSTSSLFKDVYLLSEAQIGLCFLANGGGCLIASFLNGPRMNKDYQTVLRQVEAARAASQVEEQKETKKKDLNDLSTFPIEHARLRAMPFFFFGLIGSSMVYGWVVEKRVHLAVPLIMQFIVGLTVTSIFNMVSTLLVDAYPGQSASATAANNLYRCLVGAAGTAVIDPILSALGSGWTFTMIPLIVVCFTPLIWLEWKYGMQFRNERSARMKREAGEREARREENEKRKEAEKTTLA